MDTSSIITGTTLLTVTSWIFLHVPHRWMWKNSVGRKKLSELYYYTLRLPAQRKY